MFSSVISSGIRGIDCFTVMVEADISDGMPMFDLVGYLSGEVREARERVRTAMKNAGYDFPVKRITVNLSPGNIRKQGTGYDLPMAVSILAAMGHIKNDVLKDALIVGELMLNGNVGGIDGVLPMVIKAREIGLKKCIVPRDNEAEARLVDGIEVIGVDSILMLIRYLTDGVIDSDNSEINDNIKLCEPCKREPDLKYVKGQLMARRGLEIAAAGMHNLLMVGAPGAGKSMLAKCIPTILPPLSPEESLEVSAVYSVAGLLKGSKSLVTKRPFVAPHHTVTDVAMTGGGFYPRPGNISLAHRGVLFLDEMAEFSRYTLEVLRQPLEDRKITITRNCGMYEYPSDFMLVGAMNPCPCGAYPDLRKCTCSETSRKRYMGKLSKPLLDRMDICIEVEKTDYNMLLSKEYAESSKAVRERVEMAQNLQKNRFINDGILFNSQMNSEEIEKYCSLSDDINEWFMKALVKLDVSARSYHKILRVARTIADLDYSANIEIKHLGEAIKLNNSVI